MCVSWPGPGWAHYLSRWEAIPGWAAWDMCAPPWRSTGKPARGIENAQLVVAAGLGGTLAGLLAGLHLIHSSIGLMGIDVGKDRGKVSPISIARLASDICRHLGQPYSFSPAEVPLIEGRYVGAGVCSIPSPGCRGAIRRLAGARKEILLDPVYTGKAFAGLLDLVEHGKFEGEEDAVISLHTGSIPRPFCIRRS